MLKCLSVVFLLCLVRSSVQRSTPQDSTYVAAVLEYAFTSNTTANLENYLMYIAEAAEQGADIVVFPELTLSATAIEVPIYGTLKTYPIPAAAVSMYDPTLVSLSQAALEHQIYVLVNVEEICDCTTNDNDEECPEEKIYYFNTNVVIDRNGAVIDRYRKINLFGERSRTPALRPDLGLFTTDFGVTFGHFICFDLMFQVPAVQLIQKNNITDVIFSTMWFSELPYLTAVQIQQGYAYSNNVNMLASGANNVGVGSAGSGIFSGKTGALASTMPGVATTRLLVARVPKVPGDLTDVPNVPGPVVDPPEDTDSLFLKKDPSIPSHVTKLLEDGDQEFTLSYNEVTCKFKVKMTKGAAEEHYEYMAGAFDGVRTFDGVASGGTRVCSVMFCSGTTVDTCGVRFAEYKNQATATFEEISIEAVLPAPIYNATLAAYDSAYHPVSVDVSTLPLDPADYTFTQINGVTETVITMTLRNFEKDIYSFAVWGRYFETDEEEPTPPYNSAAKLSVSYVIVMAAILNLVR